MGFFSKNKNLKKSFLVFDVRSSSVGAVFFECFPNQKPNIIFTERENIPINESLDADRFLESSLKILERVAHKMCMHFTGRPDNIFCILSSPWFASQTRVISYEKRNTFNFSEKLAKNLLDKEVSIFEKDQSSLFDNVRVLESKSIKISLDGYHDTAPFEKSVKSVEICVYMSLSGEDLLKKFSESINKSFHNEKIQFMSSSLPIYTFLRDFYGELEDFAIVDVSGETTDVSLIKKNILESSVSFPSGLNSIIRDLSVSLNMNKEDTRSSLIMYLNNHASHELSKKVYSALRKSESAWISLFEKSLHQLAGNIYFPHNIFLIAPDGFATFFKNSIEKESVHQYSFSEKRFIVDIIDSKILHRLLTFADMSGRDTILSMESIYINRYFC